MQRTEIQEPLPLGRPALFDTGVWSWVRDRRFPQLSVWFNAQAAAGHVLVCDLVVLELIRATSNEQGARAVAAQLEPFASIPMPHRIWPRARETQLLLAAGGDHRRVPPADLLLAAAAEAAAVRIVHYDRDYERIAQVTALDQSWLVPDGTFA